jgi:hypothetical protein
VIQHVLDPTDPEQTVENAFALAKGIGQIAGYTLGLNGTDMAAIKTTGIPTWVVATGSAIAGALLFARYAPEHWVAEVRSYRLAK